MKEENERDSFKFLESIAPKQQPKLPELDLMGAVLELAVEDLFHRKEKRIIGDARWFLTSRDETWLFSFISICDHLELDPDAIREGIFKRYYKQAFK